MNNRYGLYCVERADSRFPEGSIFLWVLWPNEADLRKFCATYHPRMDMKIRHWFATFGFGMTRTSFEHLYRESRRRIAILEAREAQREPIALPQYAESRRTRRYEQRSEPGRRIRRYA